MHLVLFTCYVAVQYVWLKIFFQISFSSRFSFDMTSILSPLNSYQASHSYIDISTFSGKAHVLRMKISTVIIITVIMMTIIISNKVKCNKLNLLFYIKYI